MGVFDDVVIVEYNKENEAPRIAWRYLTDPACAHVNNNFNFPVGLASICSPAAGKCQKRGMEFSFTISDGRTRQQYAFVKQLFLAPEENDQVTQVVCILSNKPLYAWFAWILRLFHARMLIDPSRTAVMSLLNSVRTESGDNPPSDFSFRNSLDGATQPMYFFPLHPFGALGMRTMEPHILNNRSFTSKLKSPTVLLVLLSALLNEQKVLIVHDEQDVLRGACQMLLRLLAPFVWKHLLIPVLPLELLHYTQAPIPYLMGLTVEHYNQCSPNLSNAIVFNLHEERLELKNLATGFSTLCEECQTIPAGSNSMVVFAKLSAATATRDPHSTIGCFRHDLQHCFSNSPDSMDTCINAFMYHIFCDDASFLRFDMLLNHWIVDTELFVRTRSAMKDPPPLLKFLTAFCSREILQIYFNERLDQKSSKIYYHGPMHVCIRNGDFDYSSLRRTLQRRATYVQEYPSIVQTLNGFWGEKQTSMKELRPLADATYNMDQCCLMIDILWERLGDSNYSTISTVLQILIFLALHGCEITMEYMRFKECQRDHCQYLRRESPKNIIDKANLLLDFMTTPHRWFTMRKSHSHELWLSTVVFPRLDIRPANVVPKFASLHHAIGRYHQPVHSVNLLDLDFDLTKPPQPQLDPFDTRTAFPTHW